MSLVYLGLQLWSSVLVFGRIRLLNVYSLVESLSFVSQSVLSSSSMGRFTPGMYFSNLRLKLFCLGLRWSVLYPPHCCFSPLGTEADPGPFM